MGRGFKSSVPLFPLAFLKKNISTVNMLKKKLSKNTQEKENAPPTDMYKSPMYEEGINLLANTLRFELNKGTPPSFTSQGMFTPTTVTLPSTPGITPFSNKAKNTPDLLFDTPDMMYESVRNKLFTNVDAAPATGPVKKRKRMGGNIFKRKRSCRARIPSGGRNLFLDLQMEKLEMQRQRKVAGRVEPRVETPLTPLRSQSATSDLRTSCDVVKSETSVKFSDSDDIYDESSMRTLEDSYNPPPSQPLLCLSSPQVTSTEQSDSTPETTNNSDNKKASKDNLKNFWSRLATIPAMADGTDKTKTPPMGDISVIDVKEDPHTPVRSILPPLSAEPRTPAQGDLGVLLRDSDSDLGGSKFSFLMSEQAQKVTCRCHHGSTTDNRTAIRRSNTPTGLRGVVGDITGNRGTTDSPYRKSMLAFTPNSNG